jgi:hypothetical protein
MRLFKQIITSQLNGINVAIVIMYKISSLELESKKCYNMVKFKVEYSLSLPKLQCGKIPLVGCLMTLHLNF